ncbi:MAG TPA: EAL domain-containing protein [Acidimicrobiales bacterium]|nr:EAL domain-containing protein [Acidimicrobiales bacterium]
MSEIPPVRPPLLRRALRALPVWLFTLSLGLGTFLLWYFDLRHFHVIPAPLHLPWPLLAVGFAAGHFAGIRLEARRQAHNIDLSDIVLVPAIAFAPAGAVLLAAAIGTLVRSVWVRRPVTKSTFNIALHAFAAATAFECFDRLLAGDRLLSVRGALAAIAAVVVAELVSNVGIQAVIALSSRRLHVIDWGQTALTTLIQVLVVAGFGLVAIYMLWSGWGGGALFAALAVAVGLGYRHYGRLRTRHAHLDRLHRFERALTGLAETDTVVATVLRGAQELFKAEVTQLARREHGAWRSYTLRAEVSELEMLQGRNPLAEAVRDRRGPVLAPKGTSDLALAEALHICGFRDAVAVALPSDGLADWVLVLADRRGASHLSFGPDDVRLAEALTMPAAMALRSSDLLDQLQAEVALKQYQASHDGLTGLANRMLFSTEMDRALSERAGNSVVGALLIDLDGFKRINDRLGHEAGDGALEILAERLVAVVGDSGTVGRLGGDEFAVVLPRFGSPDEIIELARRIDAETRAPAMVAGAAIQLRASIGVAISPFHGEDRFSLLRQADMAMYQAKQSGGGVCVQSDRRTDRIDRPSLIAALREAITSGGLRLHYQPTVSFATGEVTGVEALSRWTHPLYGVIAPDEFIPVAEASGLIEPLTRWMLDVALGQLAKWRQAGFELGLAVNVSPEQVTYLDLIRQIEELLQRHDLPPQLLTLEITESGSPGKYRVESTELLSPLSTLGVGVALDDFGVGTSSLARLKNLPVDQLKIDKSFTERLTTDPTDYAIVASTITMAHDLGLTVTAEGVETAEAYRLLRDLGCDTAQGYLISRPLDAADLTRWLYELTRATSEPTGVPHGHAHASGALSHGGGAGGSGQDEDVSQQPRWEPPAEELPLDPRAAGTRGRPSRGNWSR